MKYPIPGHIMKPLMDSGASDWKSGAVRGSEGERIRWIDIAEFGSHTVVIGLSDTGYWVRGGGATVEIANGPNAITLLPCLEMPCQVFLDELRRGLSRRGLPEQLADTFPLDDLIRGGPESGSEYWTRCALSRVEERDVTDKVGDALRSARKIAPSQELRHRAGSLLHRLGSFER